MFTVSMFKGQNKDPVLGKSSAAISVVRNIVKLVFANVNEGFYHNQEVVEG